MSTSAITSETLAKMVNLSGEAILFCDSLGKIRYCNSSASDMFHYDEAEIVEMHFNDFFTADEGESVFELIKNKSQAINELPLKRKDGSYFYAQLKVFPLVNNGDVNPGVGFFITDVTHKVSFREDLLDKIDVIEELTKSRFIRDGKLEEAVYEILQNCAKTLNVERVNAWVCDENLSKITCIGNYNGVTKTLHPEIELFRKDFPEYFKLLDTKEIIVSDDTYNDIATRELKHVYLIPHKITSMMDIPIRVEGEMIGVLCFEHVGEKRKWTLVEQKFGLFAAQLISLALESNAKRETRIQLEKTIKEKEVLLAEINHRVKNNFMIVSSLMSLQLEKAKDQYHKNLFNECRSRIQSIAAIHQMLYSTKNYSEINFNYYLLEIISLIKQTFDLENKKITINHLFEDVSLDISTAVSCGLIVNELITNAYKHAFVDFKNAVINIELRMAEGKRLLVVSDNGKGMQEFKKATDTLGSLLIFDLVEQIGGTLNYENKSGSVFTIKF